MVLDGFTLKNGLEHFKVKQNFFLSALENHEIRFGASFIRYIGAPEILTPRGDFSGIESRTIDKDRGQEWGIYLNDEFDLGERMSFSLGLRYSLYQNIGPKALPLYENEELLDPDEITGSTIFENGEVIETYSAFEPRLSMKFGLNKDNSIKMSY